MHTSTNTLIFMRYGQCSVQQQPHEQADVVDINCGHCHNPQGAADTSGLLLDYQDHSLREMGACKPPIAAGRGSGGFLYSIVPGEADESIMTFRLETTDPGAMMPELGRSLVHSEGIDLISEWIDQMPGRCDANQADTLATLSAFDH